MNISLIQIDKQSKPNKITSTTKIKWQCVIEEEIEALSAALQVVNNLLKNVVGIHEQQKTLQA